MVLLSLRWCISLTFRVIRHRTITVLPIEPGCHLQRSFQILNLAWAVPAFCEAPPNPGIEIWLLVIADISSKKAWLYQICPISRNHQTELPDSFRKPRLASPSNKILDMSRLLLSPGWLSAGWLLSRQMVIRCHRWHAIVSLKISSYKPWGIAKDGFFYRVPSFKFTWHWENHPKQETWSSRSPTLPGCLSCSSSSLVTEDHLPPLRGQRDPDKTLGNHQQKFPQEILKRKSFNKTIGSSHYMTPTQTWCTILGVKFLKIAQISALFDPQKPGDHSWSKDPW